VKPDPTILALETPTQGVERDSYHNVGVSRCALFDGVIEWNWCEVGDPEMNHCLILEEMSQDTHNSAYNLASSTLKSKQ
jgi:hypothetical protein